MGNYLGMKDFQLLDMDTRSLSGIQALKLTNLWEMTNKKISWLVKRLQFNMKTTL